MSDRHINILRHMAGQSQRELEQHDTVDHTRDAAAPSRREYLANAATRTRARVADAEQRRTRQPDSQRDAQHPPSPVRRLMEPAGVPAGRRASGHWGLPLYGDGRVGTTAATVTSARKARP